jgi:hypothetical protein
MTVQHVCTHDWPMAGTQLDLAAVRRVVADFDQHHPAAVRALAETVVPVPDVAGLAAGDGAS